MAVVRDVPNLVRLYKCFIHTLGEHKPMLECRPVTGKEKEDTQLGPKLGSSDTQLGLVKWLFGSGLYCGGYAGQFR